MHKYFLSQCSSKLVPKGLELTPERTIGNYDQCFIDNWYPKLKDFCLNLMEDVVSFCNKTKKETSKSTKPKVNSSNSYKRMNMTRYKIQSKQILHQRKFKRFDILKYKPKAQIKATAIEETENTDKPTYPEISRISRNPSTRQNLTTNLESNTKPNIHERLQSMSPTNKYRKQGKSLTRIFSKTSNPNHDKQQKISELEEEIRKFKIKQNITRETTNIDQTKMNNQPQQNPKNGNATSATTSG